MTQVLEYQNLTMDELAEIDPQKTVCFMVVSPLEAHGPHLPLGTDVLVAEKIQERYMDLFLDLAPDWNRICMPNLALGSDPLERMGSVALPAPVLEKVLYSTAQSLARWGFSYLIIADNHGGPRHLLACEAAARRAYKKHGFFLINPFARIFSCMLRRDKGFLSSTSLDKGCCGDLSDVHAGTNETSLMMALHPEEINPSYKELPQNSPPASGGLFVFMARILRGLGRKKLAQELETVGSIAAWSGQKELPAYIGTPQEASKEAGEEMLNAHLQEARKIFSRAIAQEAVPLQPPLWPLRFLRRLP